MIVPPILQTGLLEFALDTPGLFGPPSVVGDKMMALPGSRDRLRSSELRRDALNVGMRRPMVLTRLPMWKGVGLPSSVMPRDKVRGK